MDLEAAKADAGQFVLSGKLCACGCGEVVKDPRCRFSARGHHARGKVTATQLEHIKKHALACLGKPAPNRGVLHSEEAKRRMREAWYRNPRPSPMFGRHLSEDTRRKLRERRLGSRHSEIAKQKIREAQVGKHPPEETLRRLREINAGAGNPAWQGGRSFEPYPIGWTVALRRDVRERDCHTCQLCGLSEGKRAFPVHHVDYNKENCDPVNLVTLCRKCHTKTNTNRSGWISYFASRKAGERKASWT